MTRSGSVERLFDRWALNGRAEIMEKEHARPVMRFLSKADLGDSFTFLDVGCGNGWVVRAVAGMVGCRGATGIDKSQRMIERARAMATSAKESYLVADIECWKTSRRFDRAFSMEAIYYSESPESAVRSVFRLLSPGGIFFCGTDFYSDNRATAGWARKMNLQMHLLSRTEWRRLFEGAGFEVTTTTVRDKADRKKWKQEHGTLFITGMKPKDSFK